VVVLLWFLGNHQLTATPAPGANPNIVLILADDMGYGDLACQNPNSKIRTPRLDGLASQGMLFNSAHAPSALCTPSRYSLMTGQFCWRSRLKSGVLNAWDEPLLPPDRLTIASLLHRQGYATGYFGKWHLGMSWPFVGSTPPGFDTTVKASDIDWSRRISGGPVDRGFDHFLGVNIANEPPYTYVLNDHVVGIPDVQYATVTGLQSHWAGPGVAGWEWSQVLPTVVSNAEAWLERCAAQAQAHPFFLYLALPGPHQPIVPTTQFLGTSGAGIYGDYVQELDWAVGKVLDKLENSGAASNTLVIFTSDNGPDEFTYQRLQQYGHSSIGTLRGIKNDLWEGGHRVPFIARWPGKIVPGTESRQLICHVDLMRTFAEIVNTQVPANAAEDSISFLPAMLGKASPSARSSLVLESGPGQFGLRTNDLMFIDSRTGDGHNPELEPLWFKQIRDYPLTNTYPALLYDLGRDPAEGTNLYAKEFPVAAKMKAWLGKQRAMQTWDGLVSGDWTVFANWSQSNSPAGYDLVYSNSIGSANYTQQLCTNFNVNSLIFEASAQPVTLWPGGLFTLTISNGIDLRLAASDLTIQAPVALAQSQSWNISGNHTLTVGAPVSLKDCELMICGSGTVNLTNAVSGTGRLLVRSSGVVSLAGNNSFTRGTELSGGGFLVAKSSHALGMGSLEIPNNSTLQVEPGVALMNPITAAGRGVGVQNVHQGAIIVSGAGSGTLDGSVNLSDNTAFRATQSDSVLIFNGPITGDANVTVLPGAGTVIFGGKNVYTGATYVQGTLKLAGGPERLPARTALLLANSPGALLGLDKDQTAGMLSGGGTGGGDVALASGTLIVDQDTDTIYAGSLKGAGGLIKTNRGMLSLTGVSTYTGMTRVSGGALVVNGTLRDSAVMVSDGALLGGTGTITGPVTIENSGSLSLGLGTLTISNDLILAEGSRTSVEVDPVRHVLGRVQGLSSLSCGGTLVINNVTTTGSFTVGERFRIFDTAAAAGQFSSIVPAPGPGLAWNVATAGLLKVVAQPILRASRTDAHHVLVSWSDPSFHLQLQTNFLSGKRNTNWYDYPGASTSPLIIPIDLSNQALFLRLVAP
jgi:autotransporter-associated beta strand protein